MSWNSYNLRAIHISIDLFCRFYRRQFRFFLHLDYRYISKRNKVLCVFACLFFCVWNLWTTDRWKKAKTLQHYIRLVKIHRHKDVFLSLLLLLWMCERRFGSMAGFVRWVEMGWVGLVWVRCVMRSFVAICDFQHFSSSGTPSWLQRYNVSNTFSMENSFYFSSFLLTLIHFAYLHRALSNCSTRCNTLG